MTRRFEVGTEVSGLDTERILHVLARHDVRYVLVRGLAALAHGSTLSTADADVLPRPDLENLERLLDALEDVDARILVSEKRLAIEAGDVWEAAELNTKGATAIGEVDAWHFTTSADPIALGARRLDRLAPFEPEQRLSEGGAPTAISHRYVVSRHGRQPRKAVRHRGTAATGRRALLLVRASASVVDPAAEVLYGGRAGAGPLRHGPADRAPGGDAVCIRTPESADR